MTTEVVEIPLQTGARPIGEPRTGTWLPPGVGARGHTNVSQVRQLSPFRYPGGKTWLVPYVLRWIEARGHELRPASFIEPFAGGAIIGLTAAQGELADHVSIVELDAQVSAVWEVLLEREPQDADMLVDRICSFEFTAENVREILAQEHTEPRELAFQTLLRNRVSFGGILAPGAGLLNRGEDSKGLRSRWYPEKLKSRIERIVEMRDRITFTRGDGLQFLERHAADTDSLFFIDPPYTAAGKKAGTRLYTHADLDHERLFELAGGLAGEFLMTYDNTDEVRDLAKRHGFAVSEVSMKSNSNVGMVELVISRSLDWLAEPEQLRIPELD